MLWGWRRWRTRRRREPAPRPSITVNAVGVIGSDVPAINDAVDFVLKRAGRVPSTWQRDPSHTQTQAHTDLLAWLQRLPQHTPVLTTDVQLFAGAFAVAPEVALPVFRTLCIVTVPKFQSFADTAWLLYPETSPFHTVTEFDAGLVPTPPYLPAALLAAFQAHEQAVLTRADKFCQETTLSVVAARSDTHVLHARAVHEEARTRIRANPGRMPLCSLAVAWIHCPAMYAPYRVIGHGSRNTDNAASGVAGL